MYHWGKENIRGLAVSILSVSSHPSQSSVLSPPYYMHYSRETVCDCSSEVPRCFVADSGLIADPAKFQEWNIKKKAGLSNRASFHVFRKGPKVLKAFAGRFDITARHAHGEARPVHDLEWAVSAGGNAFVDSPQAARWAAGVRARWKQGAYFSAAKIFFERETVVEVASVFNSQWDSKTACRLRPAFFKIPSSAQMQLSAIRTSPISSPEPA